MFASIKNWVEGVRHADAARQRRVLVSIVVTFFVIICIVWYVVIRLGFIDWSGEWISGTHTYTASGTLESSGPDTTVIGEKWDEIKNAVGNAFGDMRKLVGDGLGKLESSTSSTSTATSSSTIASSTTTTIPSL